MSYSTRKSFVFPRAFTLERSGQQLPAGTYVVSSDLFFRLADGRSVSASTSYLEVPNGLLAPHHAGATLLITDAELAGAQASNE